MLMLYILVNKETYFQGVSGPRGYKTFFMLNSAEQEIYPAHKMLKCQQLLEILVWTSLDKRSNLLLKGGSLYNGPSVKYADDL